MGRHEPSSPSTKELHDLTHKYKMLTIFFAASAIVKLLETELSVTKHLTSLNVQFRWSI